jgi:hypothetical protein
MANVDRRNVETVRVHNISKMTLSLQIKQPGTNFYTNEQQIRLAPGEHHLVPKAYLLSEQIANLKAKGMLTVIG